MCNTLDWFRESSLEKEEGAETLLERERESEGRRWIDNYKEEERGEKVIRLDVRVVEINNRAVIEDTQKKENIKD